MKDDLSIFWAAHLAPLQQVAEAMAELCNEAEQQFRAQIDAQRAQLAALDDILSKPKEITAMGQKFHNGGPIFPHGAQAIAALEKHYRLEARPAAQRNGHSRAEVLSAAHAALDKVFDRAWPMGSVEKAEAAIAKPPRVFSFVVSAPPKSGRDPLIHRALFGARRESWNLSEFPDGGGADGTD